MKAFQKSSVRTIKASIVRFISIVLISLLGAGVLAGLLAVAPNMERVGNEYYNRQNVMDIRMLSTYGFSGEDVDAIRNTEGVLGVMATHSIDASGKVADKDYTFQINGLQNTNVTDKNYINQLNLVDGRLPQNAHEAVIINSSIGLKNIEIGSKVLLNKDSNKALSDTLGYFEYTVVGIADSAYYMFFMPGNTSVGRGSIDYALYIPDNDFIIDSYTNMFVTVKDASNYNAFDDDYFDFIDRTVQKLETLAATRKTLIYDTYTNQLRESKAQYQTGFLQYENLKNTLGENHPMVVELKAELDSALQEISIAEVKLAALGEPQWHILDRNMSQAFANYHSNIQQISRLATVFPVIFFLVAILICLTTMTRMVDEDRVLIGTFKALGYSNMHIAGKYLEYACLASLIGSIGGILLGFWLIPSIIWNAYGIAFLLPKMIPAFYPIIALASAFVMVFIISFATTLAVRRSLAETPSALMRPKAPKSGKRILLERVKPVWNRMSFTHKVTARNIGLNKKRLFMTVVGIMGCTALVVTAFGAKNAVNTLLPKQFNDIIKYDLTIGFNSDAPSAELTECLSEKEYFENSTIVLNKSAQVENDGESFVVSIITTDKESSFRDFITLSEPKANKEILFNENSVIITQKLALNLDVDIGDTIHVNYLGESKQYALTVTDITVNYTFNYIYFGSISYAETFGEAAQYNQFFAKIADGQDNDAVKSRLVSVKDIGIISFNDDLIGNIDTSLKSVNPIVWFLVTVAALLSFIVLYNLININVGERQRELATLKVLGFYNKETYAYIFREIVILSIIGCLLGLFAGVFLYRAVIVTVEPDVLMLTRKITWQAFLGAAALIMLFTFISNQFMKPRIKGIDMLESLKSVE